MNNITKRELLWVIGWCLVLFTMFLVFLIEGGCGGEAPPPPRYADGVVLVKYVGDDKVYLLSTNGVSVPDAVAYYQSLPTVEFAEPNFIKTAQ